MRALLAEKPTISVELIMITTDIIINENRVFTDVSINFQNKEYSLKVFGKHMDVESLGVNNVDTRSPH